MTSYPARVAKKVGSAVAWETAPAAETHALGRTVGEASAGREGTALLGPPARGTPSPRSAIGGAGRAGHGAPRRTVTDGRRMKQIWAPWRLAFIEQVSGDSGCIFCEKPALRQDGKTFILWRGRHSYVL